MSIMFVAGSVQYTVRSLRYGQDEMSAVLCGELSYMWNEQSAFWWLPPGLQIILAPETLSGSLQFFI